MDEEGEAGDNGRRGAMLVGVIGGGGGKNGIAMVCNVVGEMGAGGGGKDGLFRRGGGALEVESLEESNKGLLIDVGVEGMGGKEGSWDIG